MEPADKIQLIGRVVVRAGQIENAMRQCGATGTGLRELEESLGARLSPETKKLLQYIGAVRNQAAHEGANADLESWAPDFFEEACNAVLAELGAPTPAPQPVAAPEPPPAMQTPPPEIPHEEVPDEPLTAGDDYDDEVLRMPPQPRVMDDWTNVLAWVPGLHLVYALKLFVESLQGCFWYLAAIGAYAIGTGFAFYAYQTRDVRWLIPGGVLTLAGYLVPAVDGWAEKKPHSLPAACFYVPYFNIVELVLRIIYGVERGLFFGSLALFGATAIGFWLIAQQGETVIGVIIIAIAYLSGIGISILMQNQEE